MVAEDISAAIIHAVVRRTIEGDELAVGVEVLGGARTDGEFVMAAGVEGDIAANDVLLHAVAVAVILEGDGGGARGVFGMHREVGGNAHLESITHIVDGVKAVFSQFCAFAVDDPSPQPYHSFQVLTGVKGCASRKGSDPCPLLRARNAAGVALSVVKSLW